MSKNMKMEDDARPHGLEAIPIEMFLSAPPKPPIGCPLKCERTSTES